MIVDKRWELLVIELVVSMFTGVIAATSDYLLERDSCRSRVALVEIKFSIIQLNLLSKTFRVNCHSEE